MSHDRYKAFLNPSPPPTCCRYAYGGGDLCLASRPPLVETDDRARPRPERLRRIPPKGPSNAAGISSWRPKRVFWG